MARNFGLDPARLLHVEDEACAFDLRLCATARLLLHDTEREQRQLEAMSGGLLMNALQGQPTQAQTMPAKPKKMKEGTF